MSDWLSNMVSSGSIPALQRLGDFAEQRHKVIVNNIANIDTPNYRPKDLSLKMFRNSLKKALADRGAGDRGPLMLSDTGQTRIDSAGRLRVTAEVVEGDAVMFHDGSTRNMEREMTNLSRNAGMYGRVMTLLKKQYSMLRDAIRSGGGSSSGG